jgi:signal transduction histidine kinase
MLLLAFSVLYAIYSYRKRQLDEKFQIRRKIASDLHDDVGSTLSSISIMSDILQSQVENRTNAKEMIREIGFNARNMLESMDDIIWSVIPINDSFENLAARIQEYAVPLFESKDIGFKFTVPHSILQMSIPIEKRHDLFLIAKETINNLVKHSQCTEANIEFSASRAVLKMRISDNGKGFDTSRNFSRNGLKNMKYRAEKIGGKLTIHSEIDKGTIVTLVVKVR